MKKILAITGANGFIGKNLIAKIESLSNEFIIHKITRKTTELEFSHIIKNCDILVHLAGANKVLDEKEFYKTNVGLAQKISNYLKETDHYKKIIFSSSQKVHTETPYGESKKEAENILIENFNKNFSLDIFRFTNIFGKWNPAFYNSVVSTFSHQTGRNQEVKIFEKNLKIKLVYIDDVIESILESIKNSEKKIQVYEYIRHEEEILLEDLAQILRSFSNPQIKINKKKFSPYLIEKLYETYKLYS